MNDTTNHDGQQASGSDGQATGQTPQGIPSGVHLDTPQQGGDGVHLNDPTSGILRSPQGLTRLSGLSGLSKTLKDHKGEQAPEASACTRVSLLTLPWEEFLVKAYEANREHLGRIGDQCDSNIDWQLNTPLFRFAHLVWSRSDLKGNAHRPGAVFDEIEKTLKRWSSSWKKQKRKPPYGFTGDSWEDWFGVCREEAKTEFLDLWPKFRFPAGQSPLDAAVLLARRMLLIPTDDVCKKRYIEARDRPDGYCMFLSVCGHLQAMLGNRSIFLPQEPLAEALRVQGRTISRWRQWAVEDGLLKQTAAAGRRRAAEYRFKIEGWDVLTKKAPPGTAEGFQ